MVQTTKGIFARFEHRRTEALDFNAAFEAINEIGSICSYSKHLSVYKLALKAIVFIVLR